jgi:trans-aconitate methyltransferase
VIEKSLAEKRQWDPALYDRMHSFVWKYGEELIELLQPGKGERILDLGCGTGHLTHRMALSGAEITGLDRSREMIEQARQAYPAVNFVVAEAANFEFPEPFDAVFSNAALHWMKPPEPVAASIARALRPGGRLVAEFGGKGNLKAIHAAIHQALRAMGLPADQEENLRYYPSIGEYAGILEKHRLFATYATIFDRPTPLEDGENGLRNWLKMFGGDLVNRLSSAERGEFETKVADQLRPILYRDGGWFADYKRLRIVAIRE